MKAHVIQFEQPIGTFLLAAVNASDVIHISKVDPRKFDTEKLETYAGPQREPSWKRIKDIAEYCKTVDATFPTPILLSINTGNYLINDNVIEITGQAVADIVDGQHRVLGIKESGKANDFTLPVVFLLDATEEEKALIFAIINGKQTKVPASLIYDLFGVSEKRSPQKTAHEIARSLNSDLESPFYRRLKMLGKKSPGTIESLSQGTFVKALLPLISSDPIRDMDLIKRDEKPPIQNDCVFNEYWRNDQDHIILKILGNIFTAIKETWADDWNSPEKSILSKAIGFSGIMRAMPNLIRHGKDRKDLSGDFFLSICHKVQQEMQQRGVSFSHSDFSTAAGEARIRDLFLSACN